MTKLEKLYAERAKITDEQIRTIKSCLAGEITRPDAEAKIEELNVPLRELTHRIVICDMRLSRPDRLRGMKKRVRNHQPRPYIPDIFLEA